ncbi:hypothetical protein PMEGAPR185_29490 [Priestia megaterium]
MITDKHFLNAVNNTNVDFTGWDFSIITRTGRMDSDMLSWSFRGHMEVKLFALFKTLMLL